MGIIIGLTCFVAGSVIGARLMGWIYTKAEKFEIDNMEEVLKQFPSSDSYDFQRITKALSGLSDRAQATFIFLYIQSLQNNKRMLATIARYLNYIEGPVRVKDKEPAFSRPAKSESLSKGLVGRG